MFFGLKRSKLFTTAILVLPLVGCVTAGSGENAPGNLLAKRLEANPHTEQMKKSALRRAVRAELRALENAAPGTKTDWKFGNDYKGTVTPGQAFEVSGRICRRFEHQITVLNATKTLSATACQKAKGDWEPLS